MRRCNVVIPVKGYGAGKSRLARTLGDRRRAALVRALVERTVERAAAAAGPGAVSVLSPDPQVLRTARARGVDAVLQRGRGLNQGLREIGLRLAPVRTVIVPSDIPALEAADVAAHLGVDGVGISPDRLRRGTNLLSVPAPDAMPFRFGADSFRVHRRLARRLGLPLTVLDRPNVRLDLDGPRDLAGSRARSGILRSRPRRGAFCNRGRGG